MFLPIDSESACRCNISAQASAFANHYPCRPLVPYRYSQVAFGAVYGRTVLGLV